MIQSGVMTEELGGKVQTGISLSDFGSWMASEQRRIYLLCRRMLQDADEADTAVQDVFWKAYRALSKEENSPGPETPEKWLTRIAVNTCVDRVRSKGWKFWRRRVSSPEDEQLLLATVPGRDPDAQRQTLSGEIGRRLEAALEGLSDRQRAVFTLRHFESMPLDEIADLLHLDQGTVKAHLFRAVTKLRVELQDLYLPGRGKNE